MAKSLAKSLKTECHGTIICPKCNEKGSLKLRSCFYKGKISTRYYQVDHYKNNNHNFYSHSCYLGTKKAIEEGGTKWIVGNIK